MTEKLSTAADEARFWSLIEVAWAPLGQGVADLRAALATDDRFGDGWPAIDSCISRESVQNKAGWA